MSTLTGSRPGFTVDRWGKITRITTTTGAMNLNQSSPQLFSSSWIECARARIDCKNVWGPSLLSRTKPENWFQAARIRIGMDTHSTGAQIKRSFKTMFLKKLFQPPITQKLDTDSSEETSIIARGRINPDPIFLKPLSFPKR